MRRLGDLTLLLLCACGAAFAQGTTSRVLGTVEDATGAVVPGVTVKLVNEGTRVTFDTKTSATGTYVFEAVQPGSYELDVEAAGFRTSISTGNLVTIGQPATINVKLEVGAIADKVEVQATAEMVQTGTSGNYGNLVSEQAVRDLPIVGTRGRNPGSHLHAARRGERQWDDGRRSFRARRARPRVELHARRYRRERLEPGRIDTTSFRVNPDMLDEFRVLTGNGTAEYGRNSGGQVAMVTRSGSNAFHGDGFWFYRTPGLNANEWQNNLAGVGKAQLQQNIFGGDIGGPVIKNKTFFYFEIQALRARSSTLTTRTVFTATARQGILRYVKGGRNQPAGTSAAHRWTPTAIHSPA
jgi:hypothetical protein